MPPEIDEQTLTAYALGELDGPEHAAQRAEVETLLTGDEPARRQVEEIRATARWVSAELAAETTPGLSEIQHAAIERRLEQAAGADDAPTSLPLRPIRRNWAFWGSLAASVAIVCTVMATVLPKLYHLGSAGPGDRSSALPGPATSAAPFIVESPETPSVASPDLTAAAGRDDTSPEARGFPDAGPPSQRGENPFVRVADAPLSAVPTLSAYPDASARLASIARSLDNHQLPPADALRIDEIVNALPYHYAAPSADEPIAASLEVAGCPWDASHRLLRIGLRGPELAEGRPADAPATNAATLPSASAVLSLPKGPGIAGLKVQIEFNPAMAGTYRLIGYETGPSAGTFRDPPTDARPASANGIGPGRSVTVFYEVIPAGLAGPSAPLPLPPLKYQKLTPIAEASRELATVTIRYRQAATARLREFAVTDDGRAFAAASEDFRTAAAAAAFGLALRNSPYKGSATYDLVIDTLAPGNAVSASLLEMARRAKGIAGGGVGE